MIEAAGQLVALWAWAAGQRGRPRLLRARAEFHNPAGPTSAHLRLQAEVRRKRHLHFATIQVRSAETHVATAEVVLAVLPRLPGSPVKIRLSNELCGADLPRVVGDSQ